ncbi:hypothetical protein D9758_000093 [Tetrapyrgos nigripes]|uniref:Uncharacterized protein n=1 Tax=Tetrapyrgos nigripes TaxID=182062 RepID=A0A8H5H243_9AGAR|nr:hypothetical protein D9758_000093 [Tetrapyrgos nigripes]
MTKELSHIRSLSEKAGTFALSRTVTNFTILMMPGKSTETRAGASFPPTEPLRRKAIRSLREALTPSTKLKFVLTVRGNTDGRQTEHTPTTTPGLPQESSYDSEDEFEIREPENQNLARRLIKGYAKRVSRRAIPAKCMYAFA